MYPYIIHDWWIKSNIGSDYTEENILINACNLDDLGSVFLAAGNGDSSTGYFEQTGNKGNAGSIGLAVNRWRGQVDFYTVAKDTADSVFTGTRLNPYFERDTIWKFFNIKLIRQS